MSELVLKDKHSQIEFEWLDGDLFIESENSDERVCVCLNSAQAQELIEYLHRTPAPMTPTPAMLAAREACREAEGK